MILVNVEICCKNVANIKNFANGAVAKNISISKIATVTAGLNVDLGSFFELAELIVNMSKEGHLDYSKSSIKKN